MEPGIEATACACELYVYVYVYTDLCSQVGLPAVDHAVAVPQPPEAGHLVAWRSAVEVDDDVIVSD